MIVDESNAQVNGVLLVMCSLLLIFGSSWNYILYKAEQSDYSVVSVEITGQESITKASQWAVFECDIDGVVIQGRVIMNFWERKGDMIEVAYHQYSHTFVRPNLCLDGFSSFILLYCIGLSIYFVVLRFALK